jgi:toxin CptA
LAWGLVLLALASWALRPGRKLAWTPASATLVIGLCFVLLMLAVGSAWTWSETLAGWARGMGVSMAGLHGLLVIALFGGSLLASRAAGSFHSTTAGVKRVLACFIGGALMALGASFAPGSNDSLLLIGLPMFWAYAWVAFGTMCVVIALAIRAGRR